MEEKRKKKPIGWIILVVVIVAALLASEWLEDPIDRWLDQAEDAVEAKLRGNGFSEPSFGGTDLTALDIEWTSGNVIIEAGTGDRITFSETDTDDPLVWDEERGVLTIRYRKPGVRVMTRSKDLHVQIPPALAEQLTYVRVDTTSADIDLTGLTLRKLELDTTSGDVTADGSFDQLEADTTSGGVFVTGTAWHVEADTTSGRVEMELTQTPDEIAVDTTSGNVTVTIPEDRGFEAEFDTVSGRTNCEHQKIRGDRVRYTGTSNERPAEFDFDTVSGNIELRKAG